MGLEHQLETAEQAVREAGKIILDVCDKGNFRLEFKEDGSPSTYADMEAERQIRQTLMIEFPRYGFYGEEHAPIHSSDPRSWHCDPVDGTWCILNGEKTASVSVALREYEKTILAVVYNPFTDELFSGADGIHPTLDGEPLPRYNRDRPEDAVYNFQITAKRKDLVLGLFDLWEKKKIGKLISRGGSIAYNLAQVAEGSHSSLIGAATTPSNIWDLAAGVYLVESVGGRVSMLDRDTVMVASTDPKLHKKTLRMIEKYL